MPWQLAGSVNWLDCGLYHKRGPGQHSIQVVTPLTLLLWVMYLRRLLTPRRFQKAVKRLIFALTACLISFILFFSKFWGRHSDNTVKEFSAFPGMISGAGQQDLRYGDENTVAVPVSNAVLNVHVWRMQCGSNVAYLKKSLFFPKYNGWETKIW